MIGEGKTCDGGDWFNEYGDEEACMNLVLTKAECHSSYFIWAPGDGNCKCPSANNYCSSSALQTDDSHVNLYHILPTPGSYQLMAAGKVCGSSDWMSTYGDEAACMENVLADDSCAHKFFVYSPSDGNCKCVSTAAVDTDCTTMSNRAIDDAVSLYSITPGDAAGDGAGDGAGDVLHALPGGTPLGLETAGDGAGDGAVGDGAATASIMSEMQTAGRTAGAAALPLTANIRRGKASATEGGGNKMSAAAVGKLAAGFVMGSLVVVALVTMNMRQSLSTHGSSRNPCIGTSSAMMEQVVQVGHASEVPLTPAAQTEGQVGLYTDL
jgi:hypothetical protein